LGVRVEGGCGPWVLRVVFSLALDTGGEAWASPIWALGKGGFAGSLFPRRWTQVARHGPPPPGRWRGGLGSCAVFLVCCVLVPRVLDTDGEARPPPSGHLRRCVCVCVFCFRVLVGFSCCCGSFCSCFGCGCLCWLLLVVVCSRLEALCCGVLLCCVGFCFVQLLWQHGLLPAGCAPRVSSSPGC